MDCVNIAILPISSTNRKTILLPQVHLEQNSMASRYTLLVFQRVLRFHHPPSSTEHKYLSIIHGGSQRDSGQEEENHDLCVGKKHL